MKKTSENMRRFTIADTPKTYSPKLDGDVIRYLHPWVLDGERRGKQINLGVGKIENEERGRILSELGRLLAAKPKFRADCPKEVRASLSDQYFKPLDETRKNESYPIGSLADVKADWTWHTHPKTHELFDKIRKLEIEKAELQAENGKLRNNLEAVEDASGNATEREKAITLAECYKHFDTHFRCRQGASKAQRKSVLGHVFKVCNALGMARKFAEIQKSDILTAIESCLPKRETELENATTKSNIEQAAKRFFNFLMLPVEDDGLGFRRNATRTIKPASVGRIQKARRNAGLVQTLDPKPLLESTLANRWKTFAALLGYAGLRLSEAAALEWGAVDFKRKLIFVKASDTYQKIVGHDARLSLKSDLSRRVVPAFANLWTVLEQWQKEAPSKKLVFGNEEDEPWYATRHNWSGGFIKALKAAELPADEPALRLRKFYETALRSCGHGDKAEAFAGHTDEVGQAHYAKWEVIAEATAKNMPTL